MKSLVPLATLGLGRSTQPYSPLGAPPLTLSPCGILEMDELLGQLEEVSTLFLFHNFVLDIYSSWYGKLSLKTAGVCAHWIGSVVKGEQVQRRGRVVLPVSVM